MAVTDLTVLEGDEREPEGWIRIEEDLNAGAGGAYLYFAYEVDGPREPLGHIYFAIGRDRPAPPGYEKIDVDLNKGAGGEYIYATFRRRGRRGIEDLAVVSSDDPDVAPPEGFTRIDLDLNKGAGGKYIYLCYLD